MALQYYDLVIWTVFASLAIGGAVGYVTSVALAVSMPVMGLVAFAVILHGLFLNGPIDEPGDLSKEVNVDLLE